MKEILHEIKETLTSTRYLDVETKDYLGKVGGIDFHLVGEPSYIEENPRGRYFIVYLANEEGLYTDQVSYGVFEVGQDIEETMLEVEKDFLDFFRRYVIMKLQGGDYTC